MAQLQMGGVVIIADDGSRPVLRLPDPTTSPAGPGFKSATLTSKDFGMSHELNGAAIVTVKTVGQAWNINISYNKMTQGQFAPLDAFLGLLEGNHQAVRLVLPQYKNPVGGPVGSVPATTRPDSSYSGKLIKIANLNLIANYTNITEGSLIQFDNSTKVYKIAAMETVGSLSTILLNTELYQTITTSTVPKFTNIEFTCKLSAIPPISTNENYLVNEISLEMKETTI